VEEIAYCRGVLFSRGVEFLFGLSRPVSARTYALTGFTLAAIKYGADTALIYCWTGQLSGPALYLFPRLSPVWTDIAGDSRLLLLLLIWTLPFLWIGSVLSLRRTIDAGENPWLSLLYFVPILNYVYMLVLCFLSTRERAPSGPSAPSAGDDFVRTAFVRAAFLGLMSAAVVAFVMTGLCVYVLKGYGAALFFGTPVIAGAVNGYILNRRYPSSLGATAGAVSISMLVIGAFLLLFAIEGIFCLVMASPIALVASALGAALGRAIAMDGGPPPKAVALCALPLLAGLESRLPLPERSEIISSIEIDAPPEQVWSHVIGFSDLPPPTERIFQAGIAFPKRARISGSGVGAVRYCEFSTGSFVEPITRWDPPSRLSFDVRDQPVPMQEWSLYPNLRPQHLNGYFRSVAGEFRLISIAGGRTRLEGSTWYELDIAPRVYWNLWAGHLVHAIHMRVLEHVKHLSEQTGD
jgi:hypothetical protein